MDDVRARVIAAARAWQALYHLVDLAAPTTAERDAAIQRFKSTFEATWNAAQHWLRKYHGIDANAPEIVISHCHDVQLLSDDEADDALLMLDDHNLTEYTYDEPDEPLAEAIYGRLSQHARVLRKWLGELLKRG